MFRQVLIFAKFWCCSPLFQDQRGTNPFSHSLDHRPQQYEHRQPQKQPLKQLQETAIKKSSPNKHRSLHARAHHRRSRTTRTSSLQPFPPCMQTRQTPKSCFGRKGARSVILNRRGFSANPTATNQHHDSKLRQSQLSMLWSN
jgi:hypothetical protein